MKKYTVRLISDRIVMNQPLGKENLINKTIPYNPKIIIIIKTKSITIIKVNFKILFLVLKFKINLLLQTYKHLLIMVKVCLRE